MNRDTIRHIMDMTATAAHYGTLCDHAIRNDWTIETVVLYARIAIRYADHAMQSANITS